MLPLSGVVTKITLDKTTNKAGQPYSVYSFEAVDMLSPDEAAKAKTFGEGFINMLNNTEDSLNIHCTHACWWTTKNFSNGKRLVHFFMGILKIHSPYFKSPWNFHFVYYLIFLHINVLNSSFIYWFLVLTRFYTDSCTFQAFPPYHRLLILFSKKLCNEQRRRRYFILYL